MKLQEVEERRATLLKIAAANRAEASAAADLGYREQGLELEAVEIETLANSLYREDDPAIVAYRNHDEDSAEALARGTLRTLARSLVHLHASPMTGMAAAFAAAAAGAPASRDQARLTPTRPAKRRRRPLRRCRKRPRRSPPAGELGRLVG